jgi:hypothetical protein
MSALAATNKHVSRCLAASNMLALLLMSACGDPEPAEGIDSGSPPIDAADGVTHDAGTHDDDAQADASPFNYAFLTSTRHVGDLGGLEGADEICNVRASEAGLPGTFVAFLSTASVDAVDRLAGARGWVRPDGAPFADRPEDIAAGRIFYPMRLLETGEPGSIGTINEDHRSAWTGTAADGTAGTQHCANWTSVDSADRGHIGETRGGVTYFMHNSFVSSTTCDTRRPLYCFGVDHETEVRPSDSGRIAFVTRDLAAGDIGISEFDQICQAEADRSGLDGSFIAVVGIGSTHPSQRFSLGGPTWRRPDGIKIFEEAADFADSAPIASISVTADGQDQLAEEVWTGRNDRDCGGWQNAEEAGEVGYSAYSENFAFRAGGIQGVACSQSRRLYCFEF